MEEGLILVVVMAVMTAFAVNVYFDFINKGRK